MKRMHEFRKPAQCCCTISQLSDGALNKAFVADSAYSGENLAAIKAMQEEAWERVKNNWNSLIVKIIGNPLQPIFELNQITK